MVAEAAAVRPSGRRLRRAVQVGISLVLVGAVFVYALSRYRALTYLPPIPLGLAAYAFWRKGAQARAERVAARRRAEHDDLEWVAS